MDSDVLHHLLRFCWLRNFPAEQPSFEKQWFSRSTAFWEFCDSVLSISRHLTGWGREHFICESSVLPMKERLSTVAEKKELQFLHICRFTCRAAIFFSIIPSYLLVGCQESHTPKSQICCLSAILDQILQWALITLLFTQSACYKIKVCDVLHWKNISCL